MHRVATEAGGLDLERSLQGIKQSPAELVFVSSADTERFAKPRSSPLTAMTFRIIGLFGGGNAGFGS